MDQFPCSLMYARQFAGFGIKPICQHVYVCCCEYDENECFCFETGQYENAPTESCILPALTILECHHILKAANIAIIYDGGEVEDENVIHVCFRGAYNLNTEILRNGRNDTDVICDCVLYLIKKEALNADFINQILHHLEPKEGGQQTNYKIESVENDIRHIENSIKELTHLLRNAARELTELRNC